MRNENIKYGLVIFGVLQVIYILTVATNVYIGDSSEFSTTISLLGISHPPGFPLYNIVNRALLVISQLNNPGMLANYTSALFASLTGVILYLILTKLNINKLIALASALILGLSATFWSKATIAEVYTFNAFSIGLVTLALLHYFIDNNSSQLFLIFYLAGLLLSQHILTVIAFFPILIILIYNHPKILFNPKFILTSALLFVLGFSVYYYIIARSLTSPPSFFNLSTSFNELYRFLTPSNAVGMVTQTASYIGNKTYSNSIWFINNLFVGEFWLFGAIALLGIFNNRVAKKFRMFFALSITFSIFYGIRSPLKLHNDLDSLFILTYFFWSILIGLGIDLIWNFILSKIKTDKRNLLVWTGSLFLLSLPVIIFINNFHQSNKSTNNIADAYWQDAFLNLPESSIVFGVSDDEAFIPYYYQNIIKERNDLVFISVPTLANNGFIRRYLKKLNLSPPKNIYKDDLINFVIEKEKNNRPIFFSFQSRKTPASLDNNLLIPYGFIWKVRSDSLQNSFNSELLTNLKINSISENSFLDYRANLIVYEKYLLPLIKNAYQYEQIGQYDMVISSINACLKINYDLGNLNLGDAYFIRGSAYMKSGKPQIAIEDFNTAIEINNNDWRAYEYLGNIFEKDKKYNQAVESWRSALEIEPSRTHLAQKIDFYRTNSYQK